MSHRIYKINCAYCNVEMFNMWHTRKYCSSGCQYRFAKKRALCNNVLAERQS